MTDVICISSSEDEENYFKKQSSNTCQKRKLSINLDDENSSKRCKVNENKCSSDSSKDEKNLQNTDIVSQKKKDKECAGNECASLKPGSSKQHDTKYEFQKSQSDSSSTSRQSSPIKKVIKPRLVVRDKIPILEPLDNVFINFVESCEQKNASQETIKILKNLRKRYDRLDNIDKNDEEFQMFLKNTAQKVSNDKNNKFYTHIQEVKDEIKRRTSKPKLLTSLKKESNSNAEQQDIEETEDLQHINISKENMKKVRRLEKAIKICLKRIKELEEKEVDFDEEEDSAYLLEDRYKRKLVELCNALGGIVGDRMLKKEIYKKQIRRKDISDEMTGISSVDEAIISFVNSNIKQVNKLKHIKNPNAIADYLLVPDYADILECVVKCNEEKSFELTKKKMEQLAKTAFKAIGTYLKKQRVLESEEYISSFIEDATEADPATKDPELNCRLQNNKREGDKKLIEIFKKYEAKQEGLSPEDLESLSKQESGLEDESDCEITASEINDIKSSSGNKLLIESDIDNELNTSVDIDESKEDKNSEEHKIEISNQFAKDCGDNLKAEESNKNHGIEQVISEGNSTNEINNFENRVVLHEKHQDATDNISEENNTDTNDSSSEIIKSCDLNTSTTESKELNSHSINNKMDITPLVAEDDDDIQILSDDNEENTKSKSNEESVIESKEKLANLKNTDNSTVEDSTSVLKKDDTTSAVADISKDNNDNIHVTSSMSTEDCNLKSKESISTSTSFLDKDKQPKSDSKTKSNEVILKSIVPSEQSTKYLEVMGINDDIEVLSVDDEVSNKADGSENSGDKNSTSFIKVCSFAKPPDSWKDSLSPEKVSQQKLPSISTRFINPLATGRIKALTKNVLVVKNTNNHNGSSPVGAVRNPKIDAQKNVNVIRYTTSNPNITVHKILPNNHRIVSSQRACQQSGNETRNTTLSSQRN